MKSDSNDFKSCFVNNLDISSRLIPSKLLFSKSVQSLLRFEINSLWSEFHSGAHIQIILFILGFSIGQNLSACLYASRI